MAGIYMCVFSVDKKKRTSQRITSISNIYISIFFAGSSAATMLIFILPAAFYIRLVKSVPFRSPQKIGVSITTTPTPTHSSCHIPHIYPQISKMPLVEFERTPLSPRCGSSHINFPPYVSLISGDHLPYRRSHLHDQQPVTHRHGLDPQPLRLQRWSLSPLFPPQNHF